MSLILQKFGGTSISLTRFSKNNVIHNKIILPTKAYKKITKS